MIHQKYDYLIVGAGMVGITIAHKLNMKEPKKRTDTDNTFFVKISDFFLQFSLLEVISRQFGLQDRILNPKIALLTSSQVCTPEINVKHVNVNF